MDLIEFLFGTKKEEPITKTKKGQKIKQDSKYKVKKLVINKQIDEPKHTSPLKRALAERENNAVQIKKTNDILKDKSTEDLQEVEEEIRNKN
tara:strand:- start:504 stop:779 length:276 start_codon:yes stop_codon:yes gene_type:complete